MSLTVVEGERALAADQTRTLTVDQGMCNARRSQMGAVDEGRSELTQTGSNASDLRAIEEQIMMENMGSA